MKRRYTATYGNSDRKVPNCILKASKSRSWFLEKPDVKPCVTYKVDPSKIDEYVSGNIEEPILQGTHTNDVKFIFVGTRSKTEITKCIEIARELNGQVEVSTPAGRIDVLTDTLLIEAKMIKNWKHGIGQVLCYGHYHPLRRIVLFLLGDDTEALKEASSHCDRPGISVATSIEHLKELTVNR